MCPFRHRFHRESKIKREPNSFDSIRSPSKHTSPSLHFNPVFPYSRNLFTKFPLKDERKEQKKDWRKTGPKTEVGWSPLDIHTRIPITSRHAHAPIATGAVFPVHDTEKRKSAGTRSKGWWDRVVGGWLGRGGARSCYLQWNATIAIGVDAWPVDVYAT